MPSRPVTVDIEPVAEELADGMIRYRYRWVTRAEKPVRRLLLSASTFPTRVDAMRDFQETCEILGWSNDTMEVRS